MSRSGWHISEFVRNAWRHRLTPAGRTMLTGILLAGAAGAGTLYLPIYHLFLILLSIYVVAFIAGWLFRPRVEIHGAIPETTTAGRTLCAEMEIENRSRLPGYAVSLGLFGLPQSLEQVERDRAVPVISVGERAECEVKVRARRRGIYQLPDLRPFSIFPFNLFRSRGRGEPAGSLTVLPHFHPLIDIEVPVGRLYQPGGIVLTSNVGESLEYIGNREYRPGDPIRRIDFRSWARLARPVVREYQEEYYCRLALVLDTHIAEGRNRGPEGFPELEAGISLAASLADVLAQGEYIIDIFAAGPELYVFRGGRHTGHLDNILEILACVEECRESPFQTIAPALVEELRSITAIVFVLLDWDEERERFVRTAVESGAGARVLIVRDEDTTLPVEPARDWAGRIDQFSPGQVRSGAIDTL
jgi:uncharacterized protein (DUF58 family)